MSDFAPSPGRLVLVATPIGNLGDLSPRGRDVLATADVICCEDTRRTRALLSAVGVAGGNRLLSLHGHNEAARVRRVSSLVAGGATVAVVSDAGTPGISDPGARLVAELAARGETVSTVPGPSSVLAALVVSGLPTDRFSVEGFLPRKGGQRRRRIAALMADERTTVVARGAGTRRRHPRRAGGGRPRAAGRRGARADEAPRGGVAGDAGRGRSRVRAHARCEAKSCWWWAAHLRPANQTSAMSRPRCATRPGAIRRPAPRRVADHVATALGVPRRRAYEATLRVRGADESGHGKSETT